MTVKKSIHRFKVEGIEGGTIDFAAYNGKKIMVVNVASECGFTPQYEQLQELHEYYKDKLVIVGMPCDDFGNQEPGTNDTIHSFCKLRYGVTFPLTAKVSITGENAHPLYKWLTMGSENGAFDSEVVWNFQKYLLDENGYLVKMLSPSTSPLDDEVLGWLNS